MQIPGSMAAPMPRSSFGALCSSLALAAALAACSHGPDATSSTPSSQITGTVAVGAPITNGLLRILDANGAVVASDVAIDADGRYAAVTLTGPAPYRLEACGYAGPNYQCLYSVVQAAGTANVTPLTTATVLLASGAAPGTLMSGAATGLDASAVETAQGQLRQGLSGVLADGGLGSGFDFITGTLDAGSRTGYDRVLDAVGVSTGEDSHPFVQITPRMGSGNLYLEAGGTSIGQVTVASGAGNVLLTGLETLFRNMSGALASPTACADAATGMARSLASNARMQMDDAGSVTGPANVAAGLCAMFAQQDMWGSRLLSPTLGRCNFGEQPLKCRVSFVLQAVDGSVQPVGNGMGVIRESEQWKFLGDMDPVPVHAFATAQRDRRIDGSEVVDTYSRAISFDIPVVSGLQCARISQRDVQQQLVPLAYYKPYASDAPRLSLWQQDGFSNTRSLDPQAGALRSPDDTWLTLPEGAVGDEVVRNFFRGGRTVTVSLFGDDACSTPFAVDGVSEIEVDVEGVPPVWAAMPSLPWPELSTPSRQGLMAVSLAAQASGSFTATWTFPRGPLGVNGATFCANRASCGDGQPGRIGERDLSPGATSATLALTNGDTALAAGDSKMLAIYGRSGDGVMMQSNFLSCPGTAAGEICR